MYTRLHTPAPAPAHPRAPACAPAHPHTRTRERTCTHAPASACTRERTHASAHMRAHTCERTHAPCAHATCERTCTQVIGSTMHLERIKTFFSATLDKLWTHGSTHTLKSLKSPLIALTKKGAPRHTRHCTNVQARQCMHMHAHKKENPDFRLGLN